MSTAALGWVTINGRHVLIDDTKSTRTPAMKHIQDIVEHATWSRAVSPLQRIRYKAAIARVIKKLSPRAAERVADNLQRVVFAANPQEVMGALAAMGGQVPANGVVPAMFVQQTIPGIGKRGSLYLDGAADQQEDSLKIEEIYAHEMGHAIDGINLSTRLPWVVPWNVELADGLGLSKYAATNPQEGFAEFNRALHSFPAEQVKKQYPMCFEFFNRNGLVKDVPQLKTS